MHAQAAGTPARWPVVTVRATLRGEMDTGASRAAGAGDFGDGNGVDSGGCGSPTGRDTSANTGRITHGGRIDDRGSPRARADAYACNAGDSAHGGSGAVRGTSVPTPIPHAGQEGAARWAAARARHQPPGCRSRPGCARGTLEALAAAHGHTLVCRACGALVDLQAARRSARRDGRGSFGGGDGCSSAACSRHYRPGRFAAGQRRMASALLGGTRVLLVWPQSAAARIELLRQSGGRTEAAAHAALGGLDGGTS